MSSRDHAERLLFGDTLQDKLAPFPELGPIAASPIPVPPSPGRPPELQFSGADRRVRLPTAEALREPARASELLHAFANHELLAIELMALALLRYPGMDPRARRELVATIEDEQRHLRGYLSRLEALSGRFGDHPLSRFFWDALAGTPSLDSWHAGMSLTLEQANLDFMTFYAAAFERAGDTETAALLQSVRRDESAHVARGVRALAIPDSELYERWAALLQPPLSPRRARGPVFDRAGRLRAGLPASYVDRVELVGGSKGRPPDVWWFDVTSELDGGDVLQASGPLGELVRDLNALPLALASEDDVVLVLREPSAAWLRRMRGAGLPGARHVVVDPGQTPPLPRALGRLRPWGPGPSGDRLLAPLLPRCASADPHPLTPDEPIGRKSASAALLRQILPELRDAFGDGLLDDEHLPVVARGVGEVDAAIEELRGRGHSLLVIKADRSSSGRERIRLRPHEPDGPQRGWIARRAERGPLRVEPWLEGLADLSLHVEAEKRPRWIACESDRAGRFRAAWSGRVTSSLEPDLARFLTQGGRDPRRLSRLGACLARSLERPASAFPRPAGVDAMLFRGPDGAPRLHPLLEVNPRWTMGRVALRLARRISPRSQAVWLHVPLGAVPADVLLARLDAALPTELEPGSPALRRGVVPTNDPAHAKRLLTVLLVAPTRQELRGARQVLSPRS